MMARANARLEAAMRLTRAAGWGMPRMGECGSGGKRQRS